MVFDAFLPASDYLVETEEERLEELSFPAYRRKSTILHLHPMCGESRELTIDPKNLDTAIILDQAAEEGASFPL